MDDSSNIGIRFEPNKSSIINVKERVYKLGPFTEGRHVGEGNQIAVLYPDKVFRAHGILAFDIGLDAKLYNCKVNAIKLFISQGPYPAMFFNSPIPLEQCEQLARENLLERALAMKGAGRIDVPTLSPGGQLEIEFSGVGTFLIWGHEPE